MRTIKFRGKPRENGKWYYGSLVYSDEINAAIYFQTGSGLVKTMDWVYVNPETVGQFTGLYDCDGKEIYEGDILKWSNGRMYVVKFWQGMFYASVEECNDGILGGFPLHALTEHEDGKCEIVGNIYDNPELLKGGCEMNKIYSKERNEEMRLRNVLKYLQDRRNELVGQHKQAKKGKNKEEQARLLAEKHKVEADIADISNRANEANKVAYKVAIEMAMLRTKMYVLSYCLQGEAFDLKCYLEQHSADDGGELHFINQLNQCSEVLMKMPIEFGEYGGSDNESYNACEEIISKEVDRGVRAAFDEMLQRELKNL